MVVIVNNKDIYLQVYGDFISKLSKLGLTDTQIFYYQQLYIKGNGIELYLTNKQFENILGCKKTYSLDLIKTLKDSGCIEISFQKDISIFGDKRDRRLIRFLIHPTYED